jgi:hypothetical protein
MLGDAPTADALRCSGRGSFDFSAAETTLTAVATTTTMLVQHRNMRVLLA